jgi:hypothetical protein
VAADDLRIEAGGFGASLDDAGDGAGIDCGIAAAGQGGILTGAAARRRPDPAKQRPVGMPAASCHCRNARTGQSSVVP